MFVSSAALNNLQVTGVYVYNQPPTPIPTQGIDTSLSGIVGSASWGPLDTPTAFSDPASLYAAFGSYATAAQDPFAITVDGLLALAFSKQFLGVRRSDGTDVAATVLIKDSGATNGVTLTGKYSGSEGNNISVSLAVGSNSTVAAPTLTPTIQRLGYPPEVFPNLSNSAAGSFQAAFIAAVNSGISGVCPKSKLVVATLSGSASVANYAVTVSPVTLAGGTNGGTLTSVQQIGVDGAVGRTGVYTLRGTGVQQFILAGNTDATQFAPLSAFASAIGSLAVCAFPSGTSTTAAQTAKQTANLNSQNAAAVKDWVYFTDPTSGNSRFVSPLGEALGIIASLPPESSPANKPVQGCFNITGTERTGSPYSYEEMRELETAGILYVKQGMDRNASLYGLPHGQNSSGAFGSGTDTIAYTRMTNYLGASIPAMLGPFVGELQGTASNDPARSNAKAVLVSWLNGLKKQNRIDDFKVTLDLTNNTLTTIAQGYCIALVQVAYMGEIKFFLATLQGGSALQLSFGSVPNNQFV
jgi:hypothetical protein